MTSKDTKNEEEIIREFHRLDTCRYLSGYPNNEYYSEERSLKLRRLAVSLIVKYWTHEIADAFVPYLAITYFDTFASLSVNNDEGISWDARLVAICCLTIAAEARDSSAHLNQEAINLEFEYGEIRKWMIKIEDGIRLFSKPVTPFCFLECCHHTFNRLGCGDINYNSIIEIIVQCHGVDSFIRYKAFDIAFSTFLAVVKILYPQTDIPSSALPDGLTRCDEKLTDFLKNVGIKIEKACMETTLSSRSETTISNDPLSYCPKARMHFILRWPKDIPNYHWEDEEEEDLGDEEEEEEIEDSGDEELGDEELGDEEDEDQDGVEEGSDEKGYYSYTDDEDIDDEYENDEWELSSRRADEIALEEMLARRDRLDKEMDDRQRRQEILEKARLKKQRRQK